MNNPKKVSINLLSEDDVQTYQVGDNKDVIMVIYVSMAKREDLRCRGFKVSGTIKIWIHLG